VDGEISGNAIGANVQSADFDLSRPTANVVDRDNDRDRYPSALPAPLPAE
jgi:hypothetical protein